LGKVNKTGPPPANFASGDHDPGREPLSSFLRGSPMQSKRQCWQTIAAGKWGLRSGQATPPAAWW